MLCVFCVFVSLSSYPLSFITGIIPSHIMRASVSKLPAFTQPSTLPYGGKIQEKGSINTRKTLLSPAEYTMILTLMSILMLPAAPIHPASSCFICPGFMCCRLCICHSPSASADFLKSSHVRLIGAILALLKPDRRYVLFTSWARRSWSLSSPWVESGCLSPRNLLRYNPQGGPHATFDVCNL